MPKKTNPDSLPGQNLIKLYSRLLFSQKSFSLSGLAAFLGCSKQTVLRYLGQIERMAPGDFLRERRGREVLFSLKVRAAAQSAALDPDSIRYLQLCATLVSHLLPKGLFQEIEQAVERSTALLADKEEDREALLAPLAGVWVKGAIDYNPHQESIKALLSCIAEKRVCQVVYRSASGNEQTHHFAPLGLFAHRESLYADGWAVTPMGTPEKTYELTMAVQRIVSVTATKRTFSFQREKEPKPVYFGLMEDEPFQVRVKFSKNVAQYVRERIWSGDQKITERKNGSLVLEFTAQCDVEVISWVLSFGPEAKLMEPRWLREGLKEKLGKVVGLYAGKDAQ